jgi:hypothetical protein
MCDALIAVLTAYKELRLYHVFLRLFDPQQIQVGGALVSQTRGTVAECCGQRECVELDLVAVKAKLTALSFTAGNVKVCSDMVHLPSVQQRAVSRDPLF